MLTRAIVVKKDDTGQRKFELRESFECPPLGENSVAIKVKACGLSVSNNKVLEDFNLISKKEQPFGREISGIITNVGSAVTRVSIGDEVTGLIPLDSLSAGCANFCVVSEYDVVIKPENVDHVDASGCIGDLIKAYTALHYQARVCAGETLLVFSGASLLPWGLFQEKHPLLSFGIMTIQLAHVWRAKVLTTASSEEEVIYLQSVQPPIANIIDLRKMKKSLVDICMDETGGLGVDCVVDNGDFQYSSEPELLGTPSITRTSPSKHDIISCLAVAGRWVTSQADLQLDPPDSQILYLKGASVNYLFEQFWTLSRGQQGRYLHILCDIMDKLSSSVIRPVVHHTVSLEDACDTLQQLSDHKVGKIVVRM